jgi:ribosomal protein L24E
MICFIPTKGRPQTKTYKLFQDAGIQFIHFIEPQEIDKYDIPNKVSILQNNLGIGYVRNFMLNYAKKNNHSWVIMCDDDVDHFGLYNNGNIKKDANIWHEIKAKAEKLPFELIGINYRQLAWTQKTNYSINTKFVEVCVLMNIDKIKWSYRPEFNLKEDRDFSLQTIQKGNGILRFNKYFYNCPDVGTNSGGLQDEYKAKKDQESAVKMCKEWKPFLTLKNKGNRIDIKADIKQVAIYYKKIVK